MKVLVTGAAGKLGSKICRSLLGRGWQVRATDRRYAADLPLRLELFDARDELAMYRLIEGVDAVVHLANHTHAGAGPSAASLLAENVAMNSNVLTAALELGISRVVFASSIQVMLSFRHPRPSTPPYPLPYLPLDGDCPPATGTNPYALSKLFGEQFLRVAAAERAEFACTALRYPFLVGTAFRQRFLSSGAVAKLSRTAVDWGELTAHLTMEDAAELAALVLERQRPGYHQYFPAVTMDIEGYDLERLRAEFYPDVPLRRPVSTPRDLIDLTAVREATGWTPSERIRAEIIGD
jgi:nucleoside-diphosphate-sugar epimerase